MDRQADDNERDRSSGGGHEAACPTYAFVLRNGIVYCERGDNCPILELRDRDLRAFLDGHVVQVRLDDDSETPPLDQ